MDARAELRGLLLAARADAAVRLASATAGIVALADAREAATADDEHDPEGATLSTEWSRLEGLRADAEGEALAVDAALVRLEEDPTFGVCARCGRPIPVERLRIRPTATMCVPCASAGGR